MVQRQSPQNCTVLEHDLITSVFNPNQRYSHAIQAKKANSHLANLASQCKQMQKSHEHMCCLDKGLLWPKVSSKHSYLDLEFSETIFPSPHITKKTWHTNPYTPEMYDTQNWSYSKPFRHLCGWNSCRVRSVEKKIQGTHVELLDLSVVKHHKYRKGLKQWEKSNILSIVLSVSE